MKSNNLLYLIIILLLTIKVDTEIGDYRANQLIEAQQPKTVELSREEEEKFYYRQDLVKLTIIKASKFDGDPTDFSYKDQKELLNYIQEHYREILILTENYPLSLKARWPKEGEDLPRIFLKLSPNDEVHIYYSTFLSYTGYKELGEWTSRDFYW